MSDMKPLRQGLRARGRVAASGVRALVVGVITMSTAWATAADDRLVQQGEYLARAGDCISCHTRPGGAAFAGGLSMKTPFGTIVSTNITPDREQGIGAYTQEDFTRAMREGKDREGRHLYPAMPYANFARVGDADLAAMYAYFMKGVVPVRQVNAKTDLPWPFSMRGVVVAWNALYLSNKRFEPDAAQSVAWNRGAYLVQGLGHCGACHTPRSLAGGEKAATHEAGRNFLAGTVVDGWYAQPLHNTAEPGLATWAPQDVADYLKTGRNARTAAFGPMVEVVANSTQYLSSDDLLGISTYLKSLASDGSVLTLSTTPEVAAPSAPASDLVTGALREGQVGQGGALVYLNNCAACHRSDGQGAERTFPALARNTVVAAKDPTSLIRIVLQGSAMARTSQAPSQLAMPGFGWRLDDRNVADVLSFVRSSWGNHAAAVREQDVVKVRKEIQPQPEPVAQAASANGG